MDADSVPNPATTGVASLNGDRRKNARFDMHFPVILRAIGDSWMLGETADVSAMGAFVVVERPFLLNTPIEYVLTFPTELTKAPRPLRVRFFGTVLRCERVAQGGGGFGIAVRNAAHRYLTPDESANFEALERSLAPPSSSVESGEARRTGT